MVINEMSFFRVDTSHHAYALIALSWKTLSIAAIFAILQTKKFQREAVFSKRAMIVYIN